MFRENIFVTTSSIKSRRTLMRTYLLPKETNYYKANLHCHSTISDGVMTPEELKAQYKACGYSILAYTDHEVLVPHSELNDDDFLTIPGYEVQTYGDMELAKRLRRVNHINLYPKDPGNRTMPFFNMDDVMRLDKTPDISKAVYKGDGNEYKEYSVEGLNRLISKAKDAGFIVSYNHPTWSKEDSEIYTNLQGLFAMENYNHDAQIAGHDAYCPYVYDQMLRGGLRIGCISTDDTHKACDMFGGFTMVYADELTHTAIISALEKGNFYASRGPIINALWYEDGVFHIECSPAKQIVASNNGRRDPSISIKSAESTAVTYAEFPIEDIDSFVRFTVMDEYGKTANTRAYWRDEFETSPATFSNIRII